MCLDSRDSLQWLARGPCGGLSTEWVPLEGNQKTSQLHPGVRDESLAIAVHLSHVQKQPHARLTLFNRGATSSAHASTPSDPFL
jgi:hypothetical protein